jgi:hypothetical protein
MKLLVLPTTASRRVLRALRKAKKSVNVTIFRCDLRPIEKALADAVERGVAVHALIANTNRTGERKLRELEQRLLGAGVTVSRTADDLERYHDKLLIVDERTLIRVRLQFHAPRGAQAAQHGRRHAQAARGVGGAAPVRGGRREDALRRSVPDLVISPLNARARGSRSCSRPPATRSGSTTRRRSTRRCCTF